MNVEQKSDIVVPKKTYTECKKRYYQRTKEIRCIKAKDYYQLHQAELREKRKVRYYEKKGLALIERELQAMNANVVL